jgi:hypothetical protein
MFLVCTKKKEFWKLKLKKLELMKFNTFLLLMNEKLCVE